MENATRALIMAASVLIGILLISLGVVIFSRTGNVSKTYSSTVTQEEIAIFNSNFTKHLGRPFAKHIAETIINFAKSNNVKYKDNTYSFENLLEANTIRQERYNIIINDYDDNGYISNITIQ